VLGYISMAISCVYFTRYSNLGFLWPFVKLSAFTIEVFKAFDFQEILINSFSPFGIDHH
jgi:hypothetical protein